MRKIVLALVATLVLLSTFTIGVSAHSVQRAHASVHSVQKAHVVESVQKVLITPNASGGGCSQYRTNGNKDISVKACINYSYPYLDADGYASFYLRSGHGGVSACSVKVVVYRANDNRLIDNSYTTNCVNAAARNTFGAHFGPDSVFVLSTGFSYYCYLIIKLYYVDSIYSSALSPDSPNENL